MSYAKARQRMAESASAQEQAQQHTAQRCGAIGCPCRATTNMGGSGYLCRSHVGSAADKWPRITDALAQNDWLLSFIADVQKMDRELKPWREFATRFWDHDEHGKPAAFESCAAYLYRMELELLHRCGQYPKRPHPKDPRAMAAAFRANHRKFREPA